MATVLDKTFDTAAGAIIVNVKDAVLGNVSVHTLYLNGVPDANAAIAQVCTQADADAQVIYNRMVANGWVPPSGN